MESENVERLAANRIRGGTWVDFGWFAVHAGNIIALRERVWEGTEVELLPKQGERQTFDAVGVPIAVAVRAVELARARAHPASALPDVAAEYLDGSRWTRHDHAVKVDPVGGGTPVRNVRVSGDNIYFRTVTNRSVGMIARKITRLSGGPACTAVDGRGIVAEIVDAPLAEVVAAVYNAREVARHEGAALKSLVIEYEGGRTELGPDNVVTEMSKCPADVAAALAKAIAAGGTKHPGAPGRWVYEWREGDKSGTRYVLSVLEKILHDLHRKAAGSKSEPPKADGAVTVDSKASGDAKGDKTRPEPQTSPAGANPGRETSGDAKGVRFKTRRKLKWVKTEWGNPKERSHYFTWTPGMTPIVNHWDGSVWSNSGYIVKAPEWWAKIDLPE